MTKRFSRAAIASRSIALLRWPRRAALVLATAVGAASCAVPSSMPERPRVVRIQARKFAFSPVTVRVRAGVPVTLELESLDRVHGFDLPAFDRRANIVPGALAHIEITPREAGTFAFRCDVFCGDGHEDMVGSLIVEP